MRGASTLTAEIAGGAEGVEGASLCVLRVLCGGGIGLSGDSHSYGGQNAVGSARNGGVSQWPGSAPLVRDRTPSQGPRMKLRPTPEEGTLVVFYANNVGLMRQLLI